MTLYKNKYRIESARCQNWDYTSNGYYFITICTQNREYFFGDVVADKMQLSPVGKIVAEEWQKTAQIRSYIELDEWAIVPNHLHGIIIIKNQPPPPLVETPRWDVSQQATFHPEETFQRNVSTTNTTKSRLKPKSLGSIIGQIKTACTKRIWEAGWEHPNCANTFSCGTGILPVKAKGRAGCPPHKKLIIAAKMGCTQLDLMILNGKTDFMIVLSGMTNLYTIFRNTLLTTRLNGN